MSFEVINSVLPTGVKPTGDDGVFLVRSLTDPQTWYRCDVTTFICNCPRAEKGISAQIKQQRGYLPFDFMCKHLIRAICYDQMLMRMQRLLEMANEKGQSNSCSKIYGSDSTGRTHGDDLLPLHRAVLPDHLETPLA